jgi:endonuclease/exonuclease/phosphatase (EEP) superfamily protein YafD
MFFIFIKDKKMIALSVFVIGINFLEIKEYLPINDDIVHNNKFSKVMSYNVLTSNDKYSNLINLVARENPDILVLQEVDDEWDKNLTELYSKFKNVYREIRKDNFGIVFLTNYKVVSSEIIYYEKTLNLPSIKVHLLVNGQEYIVIGTHPIPAVGEVQLKSRNDTLLNMVSNGFSKEKTIIVGDLNTSMWSDGYKEFVSNGNLKNSREGFGVNSSWSTVPYMFLFQVPIDHILVTKDIEVYNFKVLENIGSDHYPIASEIKL